MKAGNGCSRVRVRSTSHILGVFAACCLGVLWMDLGAVIAEEKRIQGSREQQRQEIIRLVGEERYPWRDHVRLFQRHRPWVKRARGSHLHEDALGLRLPACRRRPAAGRATYGTSNICDALAQRDRLVRWQLGGPHPSHRFMGKIRVGALPKGVELTPDGAWALSTNFGQLRRRNLTVVDTASRRVSATISRGGRLVEVAFAADGELAYLTDFDHHVLWELKLADWSWGRNARVGINPKIVNVHPTRNIAYVSNWSSHTISVVDLEKMEQIGEMRAIKNPRGSAFTPDGRFAYVCNFGRSHITVIDAVNDTVLKHIPVGKSPRHILVTPDGKFAYFSAMRSNMVGVIDTATHEYVDRIPVGLWPKSLAIAPDGRYLYVANYEGQSVMMVDTRSNYVVDTIRVVHNPSGLAISPDGKQLWVSGWFSGDLLVFEIVLPENDE